MNLFFETGFKKHSPVSGIFFEIPRFGPPGILLKESLYVGPRELRKSARWPARTRVFFTTGSRKCFFTSGCRNTDSYYGIAKSSTSRHSRTVVGQRLTGAPRAMVQLRARTQHGRSQIRAHPSTRAGSERKRRGRRRHAASHAPLPSPGRTPRAVHTWR